MTLVQDVYFSSEFKKTYENYYNFNIPLDFNIDVSGINKIKFKLIDFSMMNSMLNVSSAHKNNEFKIRYLNVDYIINIPDGVYNATSLKDIINYSIGLLNIPLVFNYNKTTNKYYLMTSSGVISGNLLFYPQNCSLLLGFNQVSYNIIFPNLYYGENFANMLPYSKIVLATNLTFEVNSYNNFERKYSANTGVGDIIAWVPRDIPIFSTINYTNNGVEFELANKNIKSFNLSLLNEYNEYILDAPPSYIHFQLIMYDGTNWIKQIYKLISDIGYYLLSIYFILDKKKK